MRGRRRRRVGEEKRGDLDLLMRVCYFCSTITIDQSVRNFRNFTKCTIVEAIEAATLHPAQCLGISDRKGTLNTGADADLLFLNDDLEIQRVFVYGEEVELVKNKKN